MLMQLMWLFFACALCGAFGNYLTKHRRDAAKYAALASSMMFAGIGFFAMLGVVAPLALFSSSLTALHFASLLCAPLAGSIVGAMCGYTVGSKQYARVASDDAN